MADDIADAHFLLDELSKTECTVTIAANEPWGEVRVDLRSGTLLVLPGIR